MKNHHKQLLCYFYEGLYSTTVLITVTLTVKFYSLTASFKLSESMERTIVPIYILGEFVVAYQCN